MSETIVQNVPELVPVSRARARKIGRPAVVLIHEAWGRKEGFAAVQHNLSDAGVKSMAVDLPIEKPFKSFDNYAKIVAYEMKNHDITEAVIAAASLGGDTAAWVPSMAPGVKIKGLVFSAAPLQDATVDSFPADKLALGKDFEKNTEDFKKGRRPYSNSLNLLLGIHDDEYGFTYFQEDWATKVLYNECPADVQKEAPAQLRMQWRNKNEPKLPRFPIEIPTLCLWGRNDNAVTEEWCRHRAEVLLGTELVVTDSDHTYQQSDPAGMAEDILSMIR